MADILGAARVVIRAIDGGVKKDLERMLAQSSSVGRRSGESMGDAFSRGFSRNANVSNVFDRIGDGLRAVRPNAEAASEAFSSFIRRANLANAAIGGVVGGISALVGGAGALVGSLGGAGASLAVIGGGVFSMISAMVTGRLALSGMSEAVQQIRENGVNPFAGISESRAEFAAFIAGVDDDLQRLKDAAADSFLPPLQSALEAFFTNVLPTIQQGVAAVGAGMGQAVVSFVDIMSEAGNLGDLATSFSISGRLLATAGEGLGEAWDAMLSIIVASGPITERYMNFLRDRLGQFSSYLDTEQASGRLTEFFNTSGDMAATFGRILDNVFAGFGAIIMANFGPGTGGGYLLTWLESATAKFADLENTAGGGNALAEYFEATAINTQKILSSVGALISELLRLGEMPQIGEAFDILAEGAPSLAAMIEAGIEVFPVLSEIIVELLEIGEILSNTGWDMAFFTTLRDIAREVSDFFQSEFVQGILSVTGPVLGQASAWSLLGTLMAGAFTVSVGGLARFTGAVGTTVDALVKVTGDQGIRGFIRGLQFLPGASFTAAGSLGQGVTRALGQFRIGLSGSALASQTFAGRLGKAFNSIGGLLKGPLGIILGGIALIVGAFMALYNTSDAFRTEIDALVSTVGEAFAGLGPALGAGVGSVTSIIGGIGDAIAPIIPQIASFFADIITTVVPILSQIFSTVMEVFAAILPAIGQVLGTLTEVFGSLFSALLPIFGTLLSAVMPIVEALSTAFMPIFAQLVPVIASVGEQLGGVFLSVIQQLAPALQPIADAVMGSLVPAFINLIEALAPIIPMLIEALLPAFLTLMQTVATIVPTIIGALIPAFIQIVEAIAPLIPMLLGALIPAFAAIMEAIIPLVTMIISLLLPVFMNIMNAIIPLISLIIDSLVPVFVMLLNAIVPIITMLVGLLVPVIQVVVEILSFLLQALVPIAEFLANVLVIAIQVVVAVIVFLVEAIAGLIQWFADMATGAQVVAGIIGPVIANAMQWASDAINNALMFIQSIWNAVWGAISSFFGAIWNGIVAFVRGYITTVMTIITTVLNVIRGIWSSIWNGISSTVTTIWNAIVSGISGAINGIRNVITAVLNGIRSVWSSIWNSISSTFSNIWNGIIGAIQGIGGIIRNAFNGVVNIIRGAINGIIGIANGAIRALNGISVSIPAWVPLVGGQTFGISLPTIPRLAKGGIIQPSPGGTLAQIAEAGRAERVEPLDERGLSNRDYAMIDALTAGRGAGVVIELHAEKDTDLHELAQEISRILAWENRP